MSDGWIELEHSHKLFPVTKNIKGTRVDVYVSPHAVPRAVRAHFEQSLGIFRIEFRYLDGSDPLLAAPQKSNDGQVDIFLGRSSGRIERLDVQTSPESNTVSLNIMVQQAQRVLNQVESSDPSLSRRLNAGAARNAIESSFEMLSLATA